MTKSFATFYSPLTQWLLKSARQRFLILLFLITAIALYPSWQLYMHYQNITAEQAQLTQLKQQLELQLKRYQKTKLKSQNIEKQSRQIPEINQKLQKFISQFPSLHILSSKWEFNNGASLNIQLRGSFTVLHKFYQHLAQQFPTLVPHSLLLTTFSGQQLAPNSENQEDGELLYSHLVLIYNIDTNRTTP